MTDKMADKVEIEIHPLAPFLPEGARLLMLGSFPPPRKRWSMDFYYPNMQNDMWRIMGLVFFGDKDHFITGRGFDRERLEAFLSEKKIALGDTARSVVRLRGNASDSMLQVVEPVDLGAMLDAIPECRTIVTTGQKATDTLLAMIKTHPPGVGEWVDFVWDRRPMRFWRMPSSSRAYPKPLAEKAEIYARMLRDSSIV
jgi:G:T/U-mismatch repair DNA glycosylase